ncbi:MAG: hypothetical protein KGS47_17430, partial [Chloroflexi bacterium]|nr:hypothetical protein [Chloroflexota bacterium]
MMSGASRHDVTRRRWHTAWLLLALGLLASLAATPGHAIVPAQEIAPASVQVTQLAAGFAHTCALLADGTVRCWGANGDGQIGDGTTTDRLTPVAVTGLTGVTAVSAGGGHTCALRTGGQLVCWGDNDYGQLGDGTTVDKRAPTEVSGVSGFVAMVSAGYKHTCAVLTSGGAYCWGRNSTGQLGDNSIIHRSTPVAVWGRDGGVAEVVTGAEHSCARTTGGALFCGGNNFAGQVGDGSTANRSPWVAVSGLGSGVTQVRTSAHHTCAIVGGGVRCWGYNVSGQVGDGTTGDRATPFSVPGESSGVSELSPGGWHTCARHSDRGVTCWGANDQGQLGNNSTTDRGVSGFVSGLAGDVVQVAAGGKHTCALRAAGQVLCWGWNLYGQLGDGTTTNRLAPVVINGIVPTATPTRTAT